MLVVAVYDTKPHDRQYLEEACGSENITWRFFDFRLTEASAITAKGAEAVCIFVNDIVNRSCLEILAKEGVKLIALRCAGYNNLDLQKMAIRYERGCEKILRLQKKSIRF